MLRRNVVPLLLLIGAVSGCGSGAEAGEATNEPATVEAVEGSHLSQVKLTSDAARRIGLETAPVEVRSVGGGIVLRGTVVKPPAAGTSMWIEVPLRGGVAAKVRRSKPAVVLSVGGADSGLIASPAASPSGGGDASRSLYYRLDGPGRSPKAGTPVRIRVSLERSGGRLTIPYSAVIYWIDGQTWVYTNPGSLTFVRHRIAIDEIDGDVAVLRTGPPAGTKVVTLGGEELLGTEFAIEGE